MSYVAQFDLVVGDDRATAFAATRRLARAFQAGQLELHTSDPDVVRSIAAASPRGLYVELWVETLELPLLVSRGLATETIVVAHLDRGRVQAEWRRGAAPQLKVSPRDAGTLVEEVAARARAAGALVEPGHPMAAHGEVALPIYEDAFPLLASTAGLGPLSPMFQLRMQVDAPLVGELLASLPPHVDALYELDVEPDDDVALAAFEARAEEGELRWIGRGEWFANDALLQDVVLELAPLRAYAVVSLDHLERHVLEAHLTAQAGVPVRYREPDVT